MPRIELGYARTSCSCEECEFNCRFMPSYLLPADLPRLHEADAQEGEGLEAWAMRRLLASPGFTMATGTGPAQVPTLVPARKEDGSCVHLKDGLCSMHEVSPYGCAFTDAHMTEFEVRTRTMAAIHTLIEELRRPGNDYLRLWKLLWEAGRRNRPPAESRRLMSEAWKAKIAQETKK